MSEASMTLKRPMIFQRYQEVKETHTIKNRPLITFAVLAYNQERFISDAIEGAFSQTYSPLEIILSDDCSPDRTFEVIEEMASHYRGVHRLMVNRNPDNLGIAGHINKIMDLSAGELVVIAEGDDISLPERTNLIYEAWEYSGRSMAAIYSDCLVIDKYGALCWDGGDGAKDKDGPLFEVQSAGLLEFVTTWRPLVSGCTRVWPRRLFRHFGQIPAYWKTEDLALCFRSLAAGGILYINRPLVKYRRHEGNVSFHAADDALDPKLSNAYDAKRRSVLNLTVATYDAIIKDIDQLRQMGTHCQQYLARMEQEALRIRELYLLEAQMMSEGFLGRAHVMLQLLLHGAPQRAFGLAPQILPRKLYHKLRTIKRMTRDYFHISFR